MPEIHPVVTAYFPEGIQLSQFATDAIRIYNQVEKLTKDLTETHFNKMLTPKGYNKRIDDIVGDITDLYKKIEELMKLKVQT